MRISKITKIIKNHKITNSKINKIDLVSIIIILNSQQNIRIIMVSNSSQRLNIVDQGHKRIYNNKGSINIEGKIYSNREEVKVQRMGKDSSIHHHIKEGIIRIIIISKEGIISLIIIIEIISSSRIIDLYHSHIHQVIILIITIIVEGLKGISIEEAIFIRIDIIIIITMREATDIIIIIIGHTTIMTKIISSSSKTVIMETKNFSLTEERISISTPEVEIIGNSNKIITSKDTSSNNLLSKMIIIDLITIEDRTVETISTTTKIQTTIPHTTNLTTLTIITDTIRTLTEDPQTTTSISDTENKTTTLIITIHIKTDFKIIITRTEQITKDQTIGETIKIIITKTISNSIENILISIIDKIMENKITLVDSSKNIMCSKVNSIKIKNRIIQSMGVAVEIRAIMSTRLVR